MGSSGPLLEKFGGALLSFGGPANFIVKFKHQQEAFEPVAQMQAVICCFSQWLRLERK